MPLLMAVANVPISFSKNHDANTLPFGSFSALFPASPALKQANTHQSTTLFTPIGFSYFPFPFASGHGVSFTKKGPKRRRVPTTVLLQEKGSQRRRVQKTVLLKGRCRCQTPRPLGRINLLHQFPFHQRSCKCNCHPESPVMARSEPHRQEPGCVSWS
jgi:hypothetical protein